ncbi:MAG: hypothetical protein Q8922_13380 [Bacteroidota bacterium]|nr:hypothetical protein [Bacteroidota bacterium]MDP4233874.1 hypothetical protein [Bacteroidota bacterium]MDP4243547.1 hypothetical protein [Bacteroidota bacterium]MDP4288914.1 hypothetical protein [Bacteroidota bacterium]
MNYTNATYWIMGTYTYTDLNGTHPGTSIGPFESNSLGVAYWTAAPLGATNVTVEAVNLYKQAAAPAVGDVPVGTYSPIPDVVWDDDVMQPSSNGPYGIAWNPSARVVVISDDNINGTKD